MTIHLTDSDRRARLVERHRLDRSAPQVSDVVDAVLALHSSDPISPHLAAWARTEGFAREDLEADLYRHRTLWRLHAMRRTLFVIQRSDAAVFDGAVGREVAAKERARLEGWLSREQSVAKARQLLASLEEEVLAELATGAHRRTADLSQAVPGLQADIAVGSGKWSGRVPLSSRLLYVLAMELKIVRAEPAGTWRSSQYHWAATDDWFSHPPDRLESQSARDQLLRRYLESFGPATTTDVRWWSGWGAKHASATLASVAEPVELDGGGQAWVAAGDTASAGDVTPCAALLPGLDSTPMGWKERAWFLGEHEEPLFDRSGNVGPTVWIDGRIVGGWGQQDDGRVITQLLEKVSKRAEKAVAARASELTDWLGGVSASPRFPTPLQKRLAGRST